MCGICGYFSGEIARDELKQRLQLMTRSLARRGPDGEKVWLANDNNLGLGHRRLSIIDLSAAAAQPMLSGDGRYAITFNGEIYNYLELRDELSKENVIFATASDSEVLLQAIITWGLGQALKKARGMWALALYDRVERRLHLARDRFGQKPLFYFSDQHNLVFSSDLQAFKYLHEKRFKLNSSAIAGFLQYSFISGEQTIFQQVNRVENGSILSFSLHNDDVILAGTEKYWDTVKIWNEAKPFSGCLVEAESQLHEMLCQILREQKRSDVELGCFLSGGVDSTVLARMLQQQSSKPLKTFTVGFADEEFDESALAADFARQIGSEHNQIMFSDEDVVRLLPDCFEAYSDPFADTSQLPMLLLCGEAKKQVKVCLSGDGADELFAGYVRHRQMPWLHAGAERFPVFTKMFGRALCRLPLNRLRSLGKVVDSLGLDGNTPRHLAVKLHKLGWALQQHEKMHESLLTEWQDGALPILAAPALPKFEPYSAKHILKTILLNDINSYLRDDILVKTDGAAMFHGLETRLPYLDRRLFEFVASLPDNFFIAGRQQKILLGRLQRSLFPEIKQRQSKCGFSPGLRRLLRGRLHDWAAAAINDPILADTGLDTKIVAKKWQEFVSGRYDWTFPVWSLIVLSHWLKRNRNLHLSANLL